MTISKKDFLQLCDLARELNELEMNEEWKILNRIIHHIECNKQ